LASDVGKISDAQQDILTCIKQLGEATNADIAVRLGVSYEAVRQQLRQLEAAQLVVPRRRRDEDQRAGRPTRVYTLSPAGDHLFPKAYDDLALALVDTVAATLGPEALRQILISLTDRNVDQWAPQLQGKTLPERLEALKGFYLEDDVYMQVDSDEAGNELRLVERNCPYLNIASRRPAMCSVTVSTLSRLLGHAVTREKRFQDGHGRCVFRVHLDRPVDPTEFRFAFEESAGGR
jgi:predicted ArsR family transcriptional regulator